MKAAARGETGLGIVFMHDAVSQTAEGFPIKVVAPCEGTGYEVGSMSIIEGAQNVGFSLAIDEVKTLLPDLKAGKGDLDTNAAVLGVATVTVDAKLSDATRTQYGVTATSGALVTMCHVRVASPRCRNRTCGMS